MLLNNRWVKDNIVRDMGKIQDEFKENPNIPKLGCGEAVLREKVAVANNYEERGKTSSQRPKLPPEGSREGVN